MGTDVPIVILLLPPHELLIRSPAYRQGLPELPGPSGPGDDADTSFMSILFGVSMTPEGAVEQESLLDHLE